MDPEDRSNRSASSMFEMERFNFLANSRTNFANWKALFSKSCRLLCNLAFVGGFFANFARARCFFTEVGEIGDREFIQASSLNPNIEILNKPGDQKSETPNPKQIQMTTIPLLKTAFNIITRS